MAPLRELLAAHGHEDVRTLLQSGNVVLTSTATGAELERSLEQAIAAEMGVAPRVVVRTVDELAAVVERDPFGDIADQPKLYQVSFLSEPLAPEVAGELAAPRGAPARGAPPPRAGGAARRRPSAPPPPPPRAPPPPPPLKVSSPIASSVSRRPPA